jgi:hypothetical protein
MWWLWVPVIVVGSLLLLFGLLVLLGRFRNGALLRPVIARLARIGFMRRLFTKVSTAAIERQNPELASAIRKIERAGGTRDPQRAQAALARLTPQERRAYMAAAEEQGVLPQGEGLGRAERRRLEKMQRQMKKGR